MAEEDFVERTLAQLPSCHVFRIPPRRAAEGYRASEWTEKVWQGRLRIVQKGREAAIILVDAENNVFAVCPVKEGAIEKTVDSSRYFVLRIENKQGRHAFIGLAFNDRNDAFDFNVALQEYNKDLEREKTLAQGGTLLETGPSKDYSLKAGEKISISLKGAGDGARREKKATFTGGGISLAPPPGDTPSRRPPRQATDLVGGSSFGGAPAPAASAPTAFATSAPSAGFDDFGGLGHSFGAASSGFGAPTTTSSSSSAAAGFGSGFFGSGPADPFGMGSLGAALPQQQQQYRSPVAAAAPDPFGGFPMGAFGGPTSPQAAAPVAAADPFALDMFGSAPRPAQTQAPRSADPFDLLS